MVRPTATGSRRRSRARPACAGRTPAAPAPSRAAGCRPPATNSWRKRRHHRQRGRRRALRRVGRARRASRGRARPSSAASSSIRRRVLRDRLVVAGEERDADGVARRPRAARSRRPRGRTRPGPGSGCPRRRRSRARRRAAPRCSRLRSAVSALVDDLVAGHRRTGSPRRRRRRRRARAAVVQPLGRRERLHVHSPVVVVRDLHVVVRRGLSVLGRHWPMRRVQRTAGEISHCRPQGETDRATCETGRFLRSAV